MPSFESLHDKVENSVRINDEDALFLFQTKNLFALAKLAQIVNKRKNRGVVFYNINQHLNPTNICVMTCKFCSFARKIGEEGGYAYSLEEVLVKATKAVDMGATELHMVGGLHPRWNFDYHLAMISSIKKAHPTLHIKAFTAVEIDWLARKSRLSYKEILKRLKEVGLGSLPGGGAEIFHPEIREKITAKLSTEDWLLIHQTAHELDLRSNCTMLYGHIESYEHRIDHMRHLRTLQDKTGGFNCFIPLAFQPHHNEMGIRRYTYGTEDLKTLALARLYLDNFSHIKSYWVMMGQDIAQMGLCFGANDMDGTVHEEKISHMAGGRAGVGMLKSSIKELIRRSNHGVQERDTLYNPRGLVEEPHLKNLLGDLERRALVEKALDGCITLEELTQLALRADLFSLHSDVRALQADLGRESESCSFCLVHKVEWEKPQDLYTEVEKLQLAKDHAHLSSYPCLVDLSRLRENHYGSWHQLLENIERVKQVFPSQTLLLAGLCRLWEMAQKSEGSLADAMAKLAKLGVRVLESSYDDEEATLTHREITELHALAHASGIKTAAKIEFSCPLHQGGGTPLWEPFLQRVLSFRDLQQKTDGFLSLIVGVGKDSYVTCYEYLKAVLLTRIACPQTPHITAPFVGLPTTHPQVGRLPHQPLFYGQEKIAPLTLLVGADDLGNVPCKQLDLADFCDEIRSVGKTPIIRWDGFTSKATESRRGLL
ncbi:MAG: aminofutalosine synthase MqnE [Oligoflexales bacterium]|nr:aminofutalosine synthase MqnE [Oligoflexales bacterium]